ncbi:zinc finger, U1-type, Zinc finger, C2H2-like protein [Artemisia annua]|uniref:Zinc finger, U1-type, Zinc finger, C2H2-like protein n=1 Tax=Artemisia annua TaxID=35608 RepID=A0A2U1PDB2_ARTAN|nr:zinc finger, U1-type, Zinc finger, C2H2-like protein [Artemisia annua]
MTTGPSLACNACNTEFNNENDQKNHYKSEWHRYNLKRKIAGVPGVTEALFLARQTTLAEEKNKLNSPPMLYTCGLCGKGYRSSKAHAQHLNSRAHTARVIQDGHSNENIAIVKPLAPRLVNKLSQHEDEFDDFSDGSDEWEEVGENDDLAGETNHMDMDRVESDDDMDEDEDEVDPTCCFMCDQEHETIEKCMIHMHKRHGFFIPDVEYLKDPQGFLTYLGLKVKRDHVCFLEAVRKHMVAKGHCRVHYGDGDEEEEAELDEFYDYSSSYVDGSGKQLVTADGTSDGIEFGSGGAELIVTRATDEGISTRAIGSREYLRYYRQKPRPTPNDVAITAVLAARYSTMGLSTVQSKENMVRMKVMKQMNRSGVEAMRSKMGMKSNVIRNLPKNVEY